MQNKPDTITEAINLVRTIDATESQLKTLREQLRLLVGAPVKPAGIAVRKPAPRGRKQLPRRDGRNISATVREYVTQHPGVTVPQILDALHIRANEATVRAALKKSKEKGDFVSINGQWHVAAAAPKTQESPTGVLPNGAVRGYVLGEAGPFSGNA